MEKLNTKLTNEQAMSFALELAKKGLGFVEPNPAVGCVILDNFDKLIGYGYHEKYGGPHAEVNALNSVQDKNKIRGAKVFVTLEPCGHTGKTPPCSEALIEAGIGSLVYGVSDPNPLFNHAGLDRIKQKSISVEKFNSSVDLCNQLEFLVEKFIFSQVSKKTFFSLKMGSSLDGQIALQNKQSKWITGNESREHSHFLRATHDATLIGVGTLLDDNPSLNIRLKKYFNKENKVIILDPNFKSESFLEGSKLSKNINNENIFIASLNQEAVNHSPFQLVSINLNKKGKINLEELSHKLRDEGINSVLVEGGASTISEFLTQGQFNKVHVFLAPSIIGAAFGLSWTKDLLCDDLEKKIILGRPEIERFGDDLLLSYRPKI